MELKRHLDLRYVFVGLYVLFFAVYIIIGLQPAGATQYEIVGDLSIPGIGLRSGVTELTLHDGRLDTPDTIVGSYSRYDNKVLLIGHSTTVFEHLNEVQIGDEITYDNVTYHVVSRYEQVKQDISMRKLLNNEEDKTLVLMTCAGELLGNGDATHRLIVIAVKI